MNIERLLLENNPFSRPGTPLKSVKGIVLHWVANPGTSALQNRNYFESLKKQTLDSVGRYASSHFIIGLDGEVIQCIPVDEMAYHVGAKLYTPEAITRLGHYPNNCTLAIELCHPDASGEFTSATWAAAVILCANLLHQFSLETSDLWTHHGITRKECPRRFVNHPEEFERFKAEVSDCLRSELWN